MPTPRILGPMARDTPSDLTITTGGRPRRLPDDLLRQASKRLQILALVAAALWILGPSLGHHLPGQAAGGPAGERGRPGRRTGRYASASTLNPPYAIRFMSNGMMHGSRRRPGT